MNKYDIENRLIDLSVCIVEMASQIKKTNAGVNLSNQIVKSGTSIALNYGEAQSAESRKDFIHKMKIVLKELRETYICLRILHKSELLVHRQLDYAINENNEMFSIFVKSIETSILKSKSKI